VIQSEINDEPFILTTNVDRQMQDKDSNKKPPEKDDHFTDIGEALDAKVFNKWNGVPWWVFFVVWGASHLLFQTSFNFLERIVENSEIDRFTILWRDLPWRGLETSINYAIFFYTFYSAPRLYKRILRK
jgi:hypothetical protein